MHTKKPFRRSSIPSKNPPACIKWISIWLKLGEADQALRELEALPSRFWKCGWALKTRIAAMGTLRERDQSTTQA